MKHWEVRTINPNDGTELRKIFVEAPSEAHARQWVLDRRMIVDGVRGVSVEEIPRGAVIERYERLPADPFAVISESPLIQSPVWTIALGTAIGILLSSCVMAIFALAMGGSFRR